MRKTLIIPAVVSVFLISSAAAWAGEKTPEKTLMPQIDQVIDMLQKMDPEKRNHLKYKDVNSILESAFDFRTFSMLSLGTNWRRFSEKQKTEFTDLFSRLVVQLYLDKMKGENVQDVQVVYDKTDRVESASERADVYTVVHHNGTKTPVVYRMILNSGEWKVYDVIIEGVSMVGNYRDQYRKKMFDSPESMIDELREKLEQ